MSDNSEFSLVIIGAGAAGIGASRWALENGISHIVAGGIPPRWRQGID